MGGTSHYAAVIIGSGQGGTPLSQAFAKAGHRTALIESTHVGGCCINVGCTPTKTLIASGRVAYLARRGADYGVHLSGPQIDMLKVRQRKRDIVESFRGGSERRLREAGVDVLRGKASFVDDKTIQVSGDGLDARLTADKFFISTGERPAVPNIPGADTLAPGILLDSTSIQELGAVPEHLVVVGGGYVGLEFGQLFLRLGAKVTVLQRAKQLVPREDADVAESLLGILQEEGMTVHLGCTTKHIKSTANGAEVSVEVDGEFKTVTASHILFAAGRTPNTDTLNLAAAGVKLGPRGHVLVDPQLQTSNPHVWAIGDVKGGPAFTHVSYDDFRIVQRNLLQDQKSSITERRLITPYCMYTDPQLAHVGLHLHEAKSEYPDARFQVATMPMSYVARALETDETRGLMKAVVDANTQHILGFTCLGIEAGEIMSVVQMAMAGGIKYTQLQDFVFAHPTLAESLNNLWGFLEDA